jgi:hypothetical protein
LIVAAGSSLTRRTPRLVPEIVSQFGQVEPLVRQGPAPSGPTSTTITFFPWPQRLTFSPLIHPPCPVPALDCPTPWRNKSWKKKKKKKKKKKNGKTQKNHGP